MNAQKRDNNEPIITATAEAVGYWPQLMDKSAGFDLLAHGPAGSFVVEIKNPKRKWKLTANEKRVKKQIEAAGGKYHIVQRPQEFLDVVGVTLDSLTFPQLAAVADLGRFADNDTKRLADEAVKIISRRNAGMEWHND